jgi:hypothetical protein
MKRFLLLILLSVFSFVAFSQNGLNAKLNSNTSSEGENDLLYEARVYPNPCKQGKLTIEFSEKQITEVRMTNIAGKEVMTKKFDYPENKKQIQLTEIPNGIYLMRIKTTDDQQVVKKIIVAKD